jgi:hypothetical protein
MSKSDDEFAIFSLPKSFLNLVIVGSKTIVVIKTIPKVVSQIPFDLRVRLVKILLKARKNIPTMRIPTELLKKDFNLNFSSRLTIIPARIVIMNKNIWNAFKVSFKNKKLSMTTNRV